MPLAILKKNIFLEVIVHAWENFKCAQTKENPINKLLELKQHYRENEPEKVFEA